MLHPSRVLGKRYVYRTRLMLRQETIVDPILLRAINHGFEDETFDRDTTPIDPSILPEGETAFIPTFFGRSFVQFKRDLKVFVGTEIPEEQATRIFHYLGHMDVAILYALGCLWDGSRLFPIRLEWLVFGFLSLRAFGRALFESKELFTSLLAAVIFVTGLLYSILRSLDNGQGWMLLPFLTSTIVHWFIISNIRQHDPNAYATWVTFIILDLLVKHQLVSPLETIICAYIFTCTFLMMWVNANAIAMDKRSQSEAAGNEEYSVNGVALDSWSWAGIQSRVLNRARKRSSSDEPSVDAEPLLQYYSNHWKMEDRFELTVDQITAYTISLMYVIPNSLAASLCTESDWDNDAISKEPPPNSYNITTLVEHAPPHYIFQHDIDVRVNGQKWLEFALDVQVGRFLISGLEAGRSYKICIGIQGYMSVPCRILTSCPLGKLY